MNSHPHSSHHNAYPLLLFDGECNLCNTWVQFVVKRERQPTVHFAPLQSEFGKRVLENYGLPTDKLSTLVFVDDGQAHTMSTAVLKLTAYLHKPWCYATHLRWTPRFVRDWLYRWVAANRHRLFGSASNCLIPNEQLQGRFFNS